MPDQQPRQHRTHHYRTTPQRHAYPAQEYQHHHRSQHHPKHKSSPPACAPSPPPPTTGPISTPLAVTIGLSGPPSRSNPLAHMLAVALSAHRPVALIHADDFALSKAPRGPASTHQKARHKARAHNGLHHRRYDRHGQEQQINIPLLRAVLDATRLAGALPPWFVSRHENIQERDAALVMLGRDERDARQGQDPRSGGAQQNVRDLQKGHERLEEARSVFDSSYAVNDDRPIVIVEGEALFSSRRLTRMLDVKMLLRGGESGAEVEEEEDVERLEGKGVDVQRARTGEGAAADGAELLETLKWALGTVAWRAGRRDGDGDARDSGEGRQGWKDSNRRERKTDKTVKETTKKRDEEKPSLVRRIVAALVHGLEIYLESRRQIQQSPSQRRSQGRTTSPHR